MVDTVYSTQSNVLVRKKEIDRGHYVEYRYFVEGPGVLPKRIHGDNRKYKGKLYAEIIERMGGNPTARKSVPVDLVQEGKPAITAYLYSHYSMSRAEIARRLSISPDAVDVYLSQFLSGER